MFDKIWQIFQQTLIPKEPAPIIKEEPVLLEYDPSARLSANFKHYEVVKSSVAARENIDNTVISATELEAAATLANEVLEPIRAFARKGFTPNSWYRCEDLERVLCWNYFYGTWCKRRKLDPEKIDSWIQYFNLKSHPKGEAADITIPGVSNIELFEFIRDNLEYDQLIMEYVPRDNPHGGWIHVSYSKGNNRNRSFSYGNANKFLTVDNGIVI